MQIITTRCNRVQFGFHVLFLSGQFVYPSLVLSIGPSLGSPARPSDAPRSHTLSVYRMRKSIHGMKGGAISPTRDVVDAMQSLSPKIGGADDVDDGGVQMEMVGLLWLARRAKGLIGHRVSQSG
jgi:hypothetical protein